MAGFPACRHQPRSPASVAERSASPCTSPPTITGSLSTVSSPRLKLVMSPSSSIDSAGGSPQGCRPPPRRDTTSTVPGGTRAAAVMQRHSTGVRRVLQSDTDSSSLPVWRGANMAQSQLIQRRRRQMLKSQQKSTGWQHGLQRTSAPTAKRYANPNSNFALYKCP